MGRPDGAHTHGHGGGGVALVIVVLVLIASAAKPAESAARTAGHVLEVALEVLVIGLAVLAAAVVAAAFAWAGVRVYRRYTNRAAAAESRVVYQAVPVSSELREIEPPRPRLTGIEDLDPATAARRDLS